METMKHKHRIKQGGFSLIELLTVVAVMGLLTSLAMPAMMSLVGARNVPSAATKIAGVLEFARNEAMTRQTYIWVGFQNTTNANGNRELRAAVFGSDDGTPNGGSYQLSKVLKMEDVKLTSFDDLQPATQNLIPVEFRTVRESVNQSEATGLVLSAAGTTFDRVLTFTPRGEAILNSRPGPDTGFSRLVDVSVRATRGTAEPAGNAYDAIILAAGSSGKVEILYTR